MGFYTPRGKPSSLRCSSAALHCRDKRIVELTYWKVVSGLQFALVVSANSVWNLHKGEEGPCWLWEILVYRKPDCNLAAKKTLQYLLDLSSIYSIAMAQTEENQYLAYWRRTRNLLFAQSYHVACYVIKLIYTAVAWFRRSKMSFAVNTIGLILAN